MLPCSPWAEFCAPSHFSSELLNAWKNKKRNIHRRTRTLFPTVSRCTLVDVEHATIMTAQNIQPNSNRREHINITKARKFQMKGKKKQEECPRQIT